MKKAALPQRRSPGSTLRTGFLFALVSALALGALPVRAGSAPQEKTVDTASWAVLDAVTTVGLDTATLSGLGLEVAGLEPSVLGHQQHLLSVVPDGAPSFRAQGQIGLRAAVAVDGFHGFEGGALLHRGGFRLRGAAGSFDLSSFELRPGRKATTLELVDATGEALLTTADAQWELDIKSGELRYLNADLRPTPALARRMGDDRYTTVTVGVLALDATLQVGAIPPGPPVGITAPPPCGDWSGNVDVGLVNMSSIAQAGISTVNGRSVVVVLPSAELENVGTANVPWYSKFTNLGSPPWNDQHPFLVWQMSRISGGVLEPLGRSDLKHAFLTVNTGCDAGACTDSHVLGIGCADVYGTGTNNSPGSLAPRSEVTASTGIWSHCGGIASHFDTNGDCIQDFGGSGETSFTHGLKAAESDLQVAGATYYVEAFYIVRNDVNIFNSMGYRQVAPAKPGSTWTFPTVGAYAQGPAINAWVNPTTPGANADNRLLDTGEGRVQLAVRVTPVAGGRQRYAYALQNHDFDRRIKSFRVQFNTTVGVIENITSVDNDGIAANNWTSAVDATGITWTAPAGATPAAELDYASLLSFRFDSDQTATAAPSSLGVFEAGAPSQLTLQTLAPDTGGLPPGDFHTLLPCRLLDTRTAAGGSAPIPTATVRDLDVVGSSCGVPANASAVVLNVTAMGATSSGFLVVYSAADAPITSTVSFEPGNARTNNAIPTLSVDGKLKIRPTLATGGSTHVAIDVVGYFVPTAP
jgi:hypothetical protein